MAPRVLTLTIFAFLLFACSAPRAGAQIFGDLGNSQGNFSLSLSTSAPGSYNRVILTPVSGQVDITLGRLTVSVNGIQVYSGDAGPVAITTGAPGAPMNVVARLATAAGSYTEQLSIVPEDVALVAEPLSSAPPLYPGKSLVPQSGSVRMVAVPDIRTKAGARLDPSTLSYVWSVDGTTLVNASGLGRSAVVVDSPLPYRSRTVSVTVTSPDGVLAASAALDLSTGDPVVRIYERDPLLGVRFDRALASSYALSGAEATLYAGAYSFPSSLGSPLLQWFLNGTLAQTGSLITLRPTGQGAGIASLSAAGSAGDAAASASLSVSFGGSSSSSIFGL